MDDLFDISNWVDISTHSQKSSVSGKLSVFRPERKTTRAVETALNLSLSIYALPPGELLDLVYFCNVLKGRTVTASNLATRDRIMFALVEPPFRGNVSLSVNVIRAC